MSDVKAPQKGDAGSKKSEIKKTEVTKPEAGQSAPTAETPSADKAAGKSDSTPKSASQSSISHFSSVSTPAYRAGWENIFGNAKAAKKKKSGSILGETFPDKLTISDDDIDVELRNILYKALQRQARKQGFSLSKIKKSYEIEYHIRCDIREK